MMFLSVIILFCSTIIQAITSNFGGYIYNFYSICFSGFIDN